MKLFFLKIDRVPSKSSYAHHADWIECYGMTPLDAINQRRFRAPTIPIEPHEVGIPLAWGTYSPLLSQMASEGSSGSAVFEIGLKDGDAKFILQLRMLMTDVFVQSYQFARVHESDEVILYCGKIVMEFGSASQVLHEKVHVANNSRRRP